MSKINGIDPKSVPANMIQPAEMAVLLYGVQVPEKIAIAVAKEPQPYKDAFGDSFTRRVDSFIKVCKEKPPSLTHVTILSLHSTFPHSHYPFFPAKVKKGGPGHGGC